MKVKKPGPGKAAKKLKDTKDDTWEKEEKKEGYLTPKADDTTGYDSTTDDNASDDFKHGRWTKEDPPKKYKKKLKESLRSLQEKQAAKRVNPGEGDKAGSSDSDEMVTGGKTGKTTIQGRLTGIGTKKASPSAGVRVKNYTAGPKGKLPEQADAYRDLAYRIDELLPALAAGAARVGAVVGRGVASVGKAAVGMVKKKVAKKAIASAQGVATGGDTAKKQAELGQQAASDKDLEENKMTNAYVRRLMETGGPNTRKITPEERKAGQNLASAGRGGEHDRTSPPPRPGAEPKRSPSGSKRSQRTKDADERAGAIVSHTEYHRLGVLMAEALGLVESDFPKGPTAKRYDSLGKAKDTNGGTAAIKDPLVKRETEKTKSNIDKKTQSDTNPNVSDLVQGSMNRRRGESSRRGTGGLPQETRKEAKADAEHSRKKVQDAGDR
tara:strand:- start:511 stop:1824 length:1314 start_codon:yes stop_codon:yes gene_type:complete